MSVAVNGASGGLIMEDDPFAQLISILSNKAHEFLDADSDVQKIAIRAAKAALDPVATSVADAQSLRRKGNSRKRKRGSDKSEEQILHIRQIHTSGFGPKQIWEQARRVLDAACDEVERTLDTHEWQRGSRNHDQDQPGPLNSSGDELEDVDGDPSEIIDLDDNLNEELGEDDSEISHVEDIEADSDIQSDSDDKETHATSATFVEDPNGLNDGFFSIDDFNKQTQFLEQMDARGDDDNPSDEDEVDWDADPLSMSSAGLQSGKTRPSRDGENDTDEEDDSEEVGPTFGDANLDGIDDDEDNDLDLDEDQDLDGGFSLSNANDIGYADFFEPPPKKLSKTKRMRALPKTQPQEKNQENLKSDIERAMADVRRDLLDSEDEEDFDDDDGQDNSSDDALSRPKRIDKNMSTHEKQKATIAAEIRRLEAANVAKRDWQLSGEARAADRPVNSLLEEDLEFERAGKPVPVVTAETSEEIEQLIKRRILAREFDEVIRRSATGVASASDTRRGRIEVDDSKPQASLGELYEQDHLKASDPASYVDKRSAATKKQHEQIDTLWREVNEQLNLLSNLHFKPKRVDIEMKTVEDKPRITMEDARPVGELESGEGGMLAPQEVYQPGGRTAQLTTSKSGTSQNREELTREEKLRRRRREKERSKKAQANKAQIVLGRQTAQTGVQHQSKKKKSKDQEQSDIISDLKKGNVKIVSKDGGLQSLAKNKRVRSDLSTVNSGGNLKL